jgi:hypothetical protein
MFLGDSDVDWDRVVFGVLVIEVAVVPRAIVLRLPDHACGLGLDRGPWHWWS